MRCNVIAFTFLLSIDIGRQAPRRAFGGLTAMLVTLTLLLLPTSATSAVPDGMPAAMADLDGDRLVETLSARLRRARADESFNVIVTFRVPLEHVNFPLLQAQTRAFGSARALPMVGSVATRLTRAQIVALSRAAIVAQVESDEWVYACRVSSQRYFGVTRARAERSLTGDGDGHPDEFTHLDNTIAVVDTGIDASHVELNGGKVIGWRDFINNRPDPYDDNTRLVNGVRQPLGHGTHVASIAAGRRPDSPADEAQQGGVAPAAALVGVKVLDANGAAPLSTVVQGIEWCVANRETFGIRVMNLSLGSALPSNGTDSISRAVDAAVASGITVVCAAGNAGPGRMSVGSPGAAVRALTVGAVADPGERGVYLPGFSSRGPTLDGRIKPDILAPGFGITAALAGSGDQHVTYSGTSMATPFVSGLVALLLQADPSRTPADVFHAITSTARDYGPAGADSDYGFGVLDGYAALQPATTTSPTPELFPDHASYAGEITREVRSITHDIDVASTEFPIAVSLIIAGGSLFFSPPDLDAELFDPTGARVVIADGTARQETLLFTPQVTGRYTLRVYGYRSRDRGAYFFDVSADLPDAATSARPTTDGTPPPLSLGLGSG
jgi:serine protease AprX